MSKLIFTYRLKYSDLYKKTAEILVNEGASIFISADF